MTIILVCVVDSIRLQLTSFSTIVSSLRASEYGHVSTAIKTAEEVSPQGDKINTGYLD